MTMNSLKNKLVPSAAPFFLNKQCRYKYTWLWGQWNCSLIEPTFFLPLFRVLYSQKLAVTFCRSPLFCINLGWAITLKYFSLYFKMWTSGYFMYYIPDFGGSDEVFSFSIFTRNNNHAIYSFYFSNHGLNYGNID